jgi:hypothetical protein
MQGVLVRPRQAGKTHALVQWVKEGEATNSYPFWSRIILTPSIEQAMRLREEYEDLDYNQVFAWIEWSTMRRGSLPVEVAVDNLDMIVAEHLRQAPAVVTWTGTPL